MYQPASDTPRDTPRSLNSSDNLPLGFSTSFAAMVASACRKDYKAFAMVYEHYKEPLIKRLTSMVSDREAARDLLQDTFVQAWQKVIPIIEPRFEAWLNKIARNLAIDYLRHSKRLTFQPWPEDESNEPEVYLLAAQLSVAGHEEQVCERLSIEKALAAMSPKYRVCVLMKYDWGLSQAEIAEELGIGIKAVSANVSRGSKQLREIYTKMMGADHTMNGGGNKRNGRINLRPF